MAIVVFVSPHQDDETLSMGSAIRKHLEAANPDGSPVHDVHVLLLTPGSGSAAQPATGLDDEGFSRARDDEYARACRALGVRFGNIHFAYPGREVGDIALTVDEAQTAIADFMETHPDAWVKTYTNLEVDGRHADHLHTGQAAVNLMQAGVIPPNLRLYIEPWVLPKFRTAHPSVTVGTERCSSVARVQRAFDEYGDVDHLGGRYGIGYLSVGNIFRDRRADPANYWHVP